MSAYEIDLTWIWLLAVVLLIVFLILKIMETIKKLTKKE
jgi:hypothetical protein